MCIFLSSGAEDGCFYRVYMTYCRPFGVFSFNPGRLNLETYQLFDIFHMCFPMLLKFIYYVGAGSSSLSMMKF